MITLGKLHVVRPKDGRHLRKEDGQILVVEGEPVVGSSYWLRLLRDGDIEVVPDQAELFGQTVIGKKGDGNA